jgi:heat shock factor-binding protein 1
MSDNIIHKIDEMGNRIDDLERSVNDLMDEAGLDDQVSGSQSRAVES